MRKTLIACALTLALASWAWAADVDWKMYGGASINGGEVCFYESKGLITRPSSTLRVWVKCLLTKDLERVNFDTELGKKIVEIAAQKLAHGYIPPIGMVEDMNSDQAIDLMTYEEVANLSNIQPVAKFLYELNCSERMARRLSTYVRLQNGKEGFDQKPRDWEYVAPETNHARLLKILCRTENLNAGAQ